MEQILKELMEMVHEYPNHFGVVLAMGYAMGVILSYLFRFLWELFESNSGNK